MAKASGANKSMLLALGLNHVRDLKRAAFRAEDFERYDRLEKVERVYMTQQIKSLCVHTYHLVKCDGKKDHMKCHACGDEWYIECYDPTDDSQRIYERMEIIGPLSALKPTVT